MTAAPEGELQLSRAHHNRQLFSNHYLEERLPRSDVWSDAAEPARAVRAALRTILEREADALASANEAQTEERFIKPVLKALGWGYEVQPRSQRQGTVHFPDYALFESQEQADEAAELRERRAVLKRAVGVLEAKRWQRGLDARGTTDDLHPNRIPTTQIINYLIRAEQPWGILTNGVEWRLYHRDADFADTVYFAVDLRDLLRDEPLPLGEAGDTIPAEEAFRFFYLFFAPRAFRRDALGRRWLDTALEASIRYARVVEDELKPRAYRAVTALCAGFIEAAELQPTSIEDEPELAREVLDNALTLLFRLLFVLYAESRELLPVRTNDAYRAKSLLGLRERAARVRDASESVFPRGRDFWNDLNDLFRIVEGHPEWRLPDLPIYDGGLFDPAKHAWLESHHVPDPYLAEAIDLLSRAPDPETERLHYVDYAPLDVRHLGSVYEGLLEYALRVADEDLPAIRENGRVVRAAVQAGEAYLATDRGERKISGSYYTPDYIVQYIVERSLRPLIEGRSTQEILELRVLDPAIGSGHFLVAATSYLARAAVGAVDHEQQAMLGDLGELDPEHLRRLVVERCIFGVDKNPRALELAKLSLWIATVQRDRPLNFLDHHLKHGDSLLGARVDRLARLPAQGSREARLEDQGQYNAFEDALRTSLSRAVGFVQQIESLPSETLNDVDRKKRLHAEADAQLDRARKAADLWCSRLFGNEVAADEYERVLASLKGTIAEWEEIEATEPMTRARALRREHAFFHWEIEFGEVFFDAETGAPAENPGFDAVLGNPPYVRMEAFKDIKPLLKHEYATYATRSDLYVYFMERSLDLLRDGGEYGVIVSNKFLRANYGRKLRALIGERAGVREIVDLGGLPVFPDATVRPCLLAIRRSADVTAARHAHLDELDARRFAESVDEEAVPLAADATRYEEWQLVPADWSTVAEKAERLSIPLEEYAATDPLRGIVTGHNEAFLISEARRQELIGQDPETADLLKPLVEGRNVAAFAVEPTSQWMLYVPHGLELPSTSAALRHLAEYREDLEARAGKQEWYQLQQPQEAYRASFGKPKIVFPDIGTAPRFAAETGGRFPTNTIYFLPLLDSYLLAVLNSSLSHFLLSLRCARLEGGGDTYLRFFGQYLRSLPIRRIEDRTPDRTRRELATWMKSLYHRGLRKAGVEPEVPDDVRALGRRVADVDGVERVLLIGSRARGDAREDSDVDLLIVAQANGSSSDRRRELRERLGDSKGIVDLHVCTPDDVREWQDVKVSFIGHVLDEAIELYGDA